MEEERSREVVSAYRGEYAKVAALWYECERSMLSAIQAPGVQVPAGKKSVAFSVAYQSDDHTLTDDEVAKSQRKLLERLRREFNAELRA